MTFCYILTGDQPTYQRMSEASMISLRLVHPDARIVFCAHPSDVRLPSSVGTLADQVLRPVVSGVKNAMEASRALNILARRIVNGFFVKLDADMLVISSLAELFSADEVSAVPDRSYNSPLSSAQPRWIARLNRDLGWPRNTGAYFNAGMIVWPDSKNAARLSEIWLRKWTQAVRHGVALDQPSFNSDN